MASMLQPQVRAGIFGQLLGHGLVWGKQVASGTPVSAILSSDNLMWAGFQIASELLSAYATDLTGTHLGGVVVPAGVQVGVQNMYNPQSAETLRELSRGEVFAVLDNPYLAGTIGSAIMKTWA